MAPAVVAETTRKLETLTVTPHVPETKTTQQDAEHVKRYKALKKKLRRIEKMRAKKATGAALSVDEEEKLSHADEIVAEISELEKLLPAGSA